MGWLPRRGRRWGAAFALLCTLALGAPLSATGSPGRDDPDPGPMASAPVGQLADDPGTAPQPTDSPSAAQPAAPAAAAAATPTPIPSLGGMPPLGGMSPLLGAPFTPLLGAPPL